MIKNIRIATILLIGLTGLTGGVYPLFVTAVAQIAFPGQAGGSLIQSGNQIRGSRLVGQSFTKPEYFWGRLSATSPQPYNAASSSGSNFGPLHPGLKEAARSRIDSLQKYSSGGARVPIDLVTASGSGLDPEISPAAAEFQIPRVAAARHLSEQTVRNLVRRHTRDRQFGVLGEPGVNVVELNLALDQGSHQD